MAGKVWLDLPLDIHIQEAQAGITLCDLLTPREMEAVSPRSRLLRGRPAAASQPSPLHLPFVTVLPSGLPLPETRA